MNYIKKLQTEVQELKGTNAQQVEIINDFLRYLSSSKFHEDATIQVNEVHTLLINLRNSLSY